MERVLGLRLVGDVHSHERFSSQSHKASDTDLRGWRDGLSRARCNAYVGLLLSPRCDTSSAFAWQNPRLTTHVFHRDADGQVQTNIVAAEVEA
jgi:hypothetical protein